MIRREQSTRRWAIETPNGVEIVEADHFRAKGSAFVFTVRHLGTGEDRAIFAITMNHVRSVREQQ